MIAINHQGILVKMIKVKCSICNQELPMDEHGEQRKANHAKNMHPESKTDKNFINKYGKKQEWIVINDECGEKNE